MDIVLEYTPTPKQVLYHTSIADELLYGGAAGGGKSKATVEEAFIDGMEHTGIHAYLFRRTYKELQDTLIREALASFPRDIIKYNSNDHDMYLPTGSVLHFRFCRNMQDATLYQGAEMHRLYIDELTHFGKPIYDYLKTRVRAAKKLNIKPKVRCTTNPGGVGHGWVKSYFIDIGEPFKTHVREIYSPTLKKFQKKRIQYIPAYATDNPHLTDDYIFELEQKPEALRKALLLGDWSVFEGQAFTEFRDNPAGYNTRKWTHVINPFKIPKHWRRWRSFDWGYSKPFSVGYWAMDESGILYRYMELYGTAKDPVTKQTKEPNVGLYWDPDKVAKHIKEYEDTYERGNNINGIADPSIWDESKGSDGCIAKIMEKNGVYFEPADNERIAGKMQLHYRLAFDDQGYAMCYIFRNCYDWTRTVPSLVYSLTHPEDIDTDGEDHAYDETRYFIMTTPIPPRKNVMPDPPKFDPLSTDTVTTNPYGFLRI